MRSKFILFIALFSLLISLPSLAAKDLSQLGQFNPENIIEQKLPASSFESFTVARLKHPKLIWVNWDLLREMGYQVPQTIDTATNNQLLQALGWVSADPYVLEQDITKERKQMVADFYGGTGLGYNLGSARAASSGDIQLKGVGITPHLRGYDSKHTARSTIHEAIKDAVWGEVLNNEMPYGGNRIIAILDRGGALENDEPQVIEVRQDPLRMGHFILRSHTSDEEDHERISHADKYLANSLPVPAAGFPPDASNGLKIVLGMKEYSRRVGLQFGQFFMQRLFHGATSESNIEISGRMIDFGTASAQPGYEKISFLEHVAPFGAMGEMREFLIRSLANKTVLDDSTQEEIRKALGILGNKFMTFRRWSDVLADEMVVEFNSSYNLARQNMSLRFLGLPAVFAEVLLPRHKEVADLLVKIVLSEMQASSLVKLTEISTLHHRAPELLEKLISAIHEAHAYAAQSLTLTLAHFPDLAKHLSPAESQKLPSLLAELFSEAMQMAEAKGAYRGNFEKLMGANSRFLNRPIEDLFLPDLRKRTQQVTEDYMKGDTAAPGKAIESIVTSSYRSVQNLPWNHAPVGIVGRDGLKVNMQVFDAVKGGLQMRSYKPTERQQKAPSSSPAGLFCSDVFQRGA